MNRGALFVIVLLAAPVWADLAEPPALTGIGIDEHVGATLPGDVELVDSNGAHARLDTVIGGSRPALLVLGYFRCPMLCGLVLNGVVRGLRESPLRVGDDVDVVAVSIAPEEAPDDARRRAEEVLGAEAVTKRGWRFYVGEAAGVRRLAEAVGFGYRYDPASQQYAHAAAVVAVTPARRISGYLYGFAPSSADLQTAVRAAAAGQNTPLFERVLMQCFRYTPALRRYADSIALLLKFTGILILAALGGVMLFAVRRRVHA